MTSCFLSQVHFVLRRNLESALDARRIATRRRRRLLPSCNLNLASEF